MTRINCVPVEELSRQHLIAEYRELPRVFALAAAAHDRGLLPRDFPDRYALGRGHVLFFYARLGYAARRLGELIAEMLRRGYRPTYLKVLPPDLPPEWHADWEPDVEALAANRQRIAERTKEKKK